MKLIITAKDEDLDLTVDVVEDMGFNLEKEGYKWKSCKCLSNGTSLILEK